MSFIITILGLGAGEIEQLPLGIYRLLTKGHVPVYVRTEAHPVVQQLQREGIEYTSFDDIYEEHDNFQDVYTAIVTDLTRAAQKSSIIYAVPGHPMVAEKTVQLLQAQTEVPIEIKGGQSFLDDLFTALQIDPIDGFQLLDATDFDRETINYDAHLIISQVYDTFTASDVKLDLLEDLPPDYEVVIVDAVGTADEKMHYVPLKELDHSFQFSNLTSIYVPPLRDKLLMHKFSTLRGVIHTLRGPEGCPWDKKQTHESLRHYALEEVYELIEAIDKEDDEAIIEELGDVLLQVMLHSQIGDDNGYFSVDDVIASITRKMIHRHPHVFGDKNSKKTWEQLKREEKGGREQDEFLLDEVIRDATPLHVAYELQKQAAKIGFDWPNVEDMWKKLTEEKKEFYEAVKQGNGREMEAEFGDMFFVLVNISRYYNIHPEIALQRTNKKFRTRFNYIERKVRKSGKQLSEMSLEQLDIFWDEAKRKE